MDSATNYEAYKGLYSSHNDHNYFEVAHTLGRQFGQEGIYKNLTLYNFADNHDTTRVASILNEPQHLFPLHVILFTIPGIPSIYYGSEWGITALKGAHDDTSLRPKVDRVPDLSGSVLYHYLQKLAIIRRQHPALRKGRYFELYVSQYQLVFGRQVAEELIIVAVNAADMPVSIEVKTDQAEFMDALEPNFRISATRQTLLITDVPAYGGRILLRLPTRSVDELF